MTIEKRPFSIVVIRLLLFILIYLFYTIIKMNLIINYTPLLDANLNSLLFIYVIINLNYLFYKL
ncbi:putative membrane protein (plasmid) [Bacillus pseudomycoides]|nr:putative membrane protein [Bacillus pseudomycoides]